MIPLTHCRSLLRGAVRLYVLVALVFALIPMWLWAEAPAWWAERGVLNPAATADDYAAVNQGQVKHIAKQAYEEMEAKLSGGAGQTLDAIWATPAASSDDYRAFNLGQLKNVAEPFYARLQALTYTGQPLTAGQTRPWGTGTDDFALANIGQVKNLFSFNIVSPYSDPVNLLITPVSETSASLAWNVGPDVATIVQVSIDNGATWKTLTVLAAGIDAYSVTDFPSIGNAQFQVLKSANGVVSASLIDWMQRNNINPASSSLTEDEDLDGLTTAEEAQRGTNPKLADSDNDGIKDLDDGWPRHSWIKIPPLPEVNYAVVRLRSLGWPTNLVAAEIDDLSNVLSGPWPGVSDPSNNLNRQLSYWHSATGQFENFFIGYVKEGPPYINIDNLRVLGDAGHVVGFIYGSSAGHFSRQAARWTSGTTEPVKIAGAGNDNHVYASEATAVNKSGETAGVASLAGTDESGESYRQYGGRLFSPDAWLGTPAEQDAEYREIFVPIKINKTGLIGVHKITTTAEEHDYMQAAGVIEADVFVPLNLGSAFVCAVTDGASGGAPTVVLGYSGWAHKEGDVWQSESLMIWDPEARKEIIASATQVTDRLEFIDIRNGIKQKLQDRLPTGWISTGGKDINNHGVILANAKRTLGDAGQPIPSPQSEPVLLIPFNVYVDADNTTIKNYPDVSRGDCGSLEEFSKNSDNEGSHPGVRVYANLIDVDNDGVPGYADGIDKFGNGEANSCWKFEPMLINSSSLNAFPSAKFKFRYSASDPDKLTRDGYGSYILPEDKVLRIWKKDGDEIRKPQSVDQAGDFIKSDQEYTADQLGWHAGDTTIRLYIEVVAARAVESFSVEIEFYPMGTSHLENVGKQKFKVRPYYVSRENLGVNDGILSHE